MGTPKTRSVIKAFKLLQSFRQDDEWLTCAELSRRAKLPEASGYRLLQTLEELGAVVRGSREFRPKLYPSSTEVVRVARLVPKEQRAAM